MQTPRNRKVFTYKVPRANTCSKFIQIQQKKMFIKELSKRLP